MSYLPLSIFFTLRGEGLTVLGFLPGPDEPFLHCPGAGGLNGLMVSLATFFNTIVLEPVGLSFGLLMVTYTLFFSWGAWLLVLISVSLWPFTTTGSRALDVTTCEFWNLDGGVKGLFLGGGYKGALGAGLGFSGEPGFRKGLCALDEYCCLEFPSPLLEDFRALQNTTHVTRSNTSLETLIKFIFMYFTKLI